MTSDALKTYQSTTEDVYTQVETRELARLRAVEAAALRVASSRRDGVVVDKGALDKLDAELEWG